MLHSLAGQNEKAMIQNTTNLSITDGVSVVFHFSFCFSTLSDYCVHLSCCSMKTTTTVPSPEQDYQQCQINHITTKNWPYRSYSQVQTKKSLPPFLVQNSVTVLCVLLGSTWEGALRSQLPPSWGNMASKIHRANQPNEWAVLFSNLPIKTQGHVGTLINRGKSYSATNTKHS